MEIFWTDEVLWTDPEARWTVVEIVIEPEPQPTPTGGGGFPKRRRRKRIRITVLIDGQAFEVSRLIDSKVKYQDKNYIIREAKIVELQEIENRSITVYDITTTN